METWFKKNYKTIIISAFLIPIITVALVSISHVTKWYGLSNPFTWAAYLSIGIEIAALSALAAISADMGRKVYFPFGIVTLIQFIGNVYFAYSFIDVNSESFRSWVELVAPFVEFMGVDPTDFVGHKRFLSFFAGGMLPIISLSFLHMLVKFTQENKERDNIEVEKKEEVKEEVPVVNAKDIVGEVSRVRLSEEDLAILERVLNNPPKPNDELIRAAEKYKEKTPEITHTEDLSDFFPELFETPEEMDETMVDDVDETITITTTPTITSTPSPMPTLSEIIEPEKVMEVLPEEIIPMVDPIVEEPIDNEMTQLQRLEDYVMKLHTPPQNASEMMLTSNEDIIESIPSDDEFSDWDITLMDGLEDEPITENLVDFFPEIHEEPQDIVIPETLNEISTIEFEEEKKKPIESQSQVISSLNDGLEQVTDTIENDDLYWESEDNNQEDTLTVELSPRTSPMKKTIMRNVGNTQRRKFR